MTVVAASFIFFLLVFLGIGIYSATRKQNTTSDSHRGRHCRPDRADLPGHLRRRSAHGGQQCAPLAMRARREEVGDGMWNIVYYNTILGRIDLQAGRITGIDHL